MDSTEAATRVARPKRIKSRQRRTEPTPRRRSTPGGSQEAVGIRAVTPARILIPAPRAIRATYCWRDTWLTGFDSVFVLLWKFALLNGLTARELARLVVSATCGRRMRVLKQLNLDLRDSSAIDISRFARLCHTTEEAIGQGFVFGNFTAQPGECATVLRYCPECLCRGWHFALHQLKFVSRCPIHQRPLQETCTVCGDRILYQLSAPVFNEPFTCTHCHADLAPALRAPGVQALDEEERAVLRNAMDVAAGLSAFLRHHHPLAQLLSFFGTNRALISPPSPRRAREEYVDFLDALVRRLRADLSSSSSRDCALIEIECGEHGGQARIPSAARRALHRMRRRVRSHSGEPKVGARPDDTRWEAVDRGLTDHKFASIVPLYRAVRRHVWRAAVGVHRPCARLAASQLDYDTEGQHIPTFCPVASAYLRWRMYWEGVRVPADLFRPPRHIPFGVLGWLCDGAPVALEPWTSRAEAWLAHRVFAMDCIRDFGAWWKLCESRASVTQIRWSRAAAGGYGHTYWGATGQDRPTSPLRVFLETRKHSDWSCDSVACEAHPRFYKALRNKECHRDSECSPVVGA